MWVQKNRIPEHAETQFPVEHELVVSRRLQQSHPYELILPQEYEPGYAYPLLVYFHDDGGNEQHLHRWMNHISRQNFIGLGLRAPLLDRSLLPGRYRWASRRRPLYRQMEDIIGELRLDWNIHLKRIVLFGEGTGGVLALRIWLRYRHSFAGAIALQPEEHWERKLPPLAADLDGRILLGGLQDAAGSAAAIDGLTEAGIDVRLIDAPLENRPAVGSAINHWMMSGISTAIW